MVVCGWFVGGAGGFGVCLFVVSACLVVGGGFAFLGSLGLVANCWCFVVIC